MNTLENNVTNLVKDTRNNFSIILNPEEQKYIDNIPGVYIENFTTPFFERLSLIENFKFYKRWFNSKIDIDSLIVNFGLTHVKTTRTKDLEYNDYVMARIAVSCIQNNDKIMLIEPLYKLHTTTIKKLIKALDDTYSDKQFIFIFNQIQNAMIVTDNVYRYKNSKFNLIEVDDSETSVSKAPEAFRIVVKFEDKTIFIKPEDIDYIEAQDGKSFISIKGETYRSDYTMKHLEERLTPYGFFRCHRSYIVNLQKVNEIITWSKNSYSIKLQQDEKMYIPLSRQKVNELNTIFDTI